MLIAFFLSKCCQNKRLTISYLWLVIESVFYSVLIPFLLAGIIYVIGQLFKGSINIWNSSVIIYDKFEAVPLISPVFKIILILQFIFMSIDYLSYGFSGKKLSDIKEKIIRKRETLLFMRISFGVGISIFLIAFLLIF